MLLRNLRQALLRLLHAPLFTVIAILTLTLGIGANTAIFSVVQGVLLHPAGVEDPGSLVSFHARYTQLNLPSIGVSAPDQADAASLSSIVSSSAMYDPQSFNAQQDGHTLHLLAAEVTWPWFRSFGAQPILGRTFQPEDDQKGAARTVVLSYGAWQHLFGGQHDAIGKSLVMDGQPYRVIGVMRSDFDWPRSRDAWVPLGLAPDAYAAGERYNEFYSSVVRLRPGVSVAQFNAAIDQKHLEQIRREGSGSFGQSAGWSMFAEPWTNDAAGDLRKPLIALFAVVGGVLLIACLNVAGLFLARASARARELALRIALGASRSQIASLFISEVLLLAGFATILGVFAGPLIGRLILSAIPHDLAAGFSVHTDLRLVLAAAAIGLLSALCAGMAPVWSVLRQGRTLRLTDGLRTSTGGSGKQRLRAILVSSEMAIAFLLVAGTGMFLSSLVPSAAGRSRLPPSRRHDWLGHTHQRAISRQRSAPCRLCGRCAQSSSSGAGSERCSRRLSAPLRRLYQTFRQLRDRKSANAPQRARPACRQALGYLRLPCCHANTAVARPLLHQQRYRHYAARRGDRRCSSEGILAAQRTQSASAFVLAGATNGRRSSASSLTPAATRSRWMRTKVSSTPPSHRNPSTASPSSRVLLPTPKTCAFRWSSRSKLPMALKHSTT